MSERQIGVIIDGATRRMGTTSTSPSCRRSPPRVACRCASAIVDPDLLLVGRDPNRLTARLRRTATAMTPPSRRGPRQYGRDLYGLCHDRRTPERGPPWIAAGKHIHIENPSAPRSKRR